jgi:nitric oxide reductase activation protein
MPKVKPFHGCFDRFKRDASKTTDICSGEWTHVRGRKTMGMSQKEISKFLASKALKDAKLVRELEVVPKKTIPYLNPHDLFGNPKKSSQSKEPRVKQLKKKAEKAKQQKTIIEPTMEMIEKELQTNITDLRASENRVRNISKELEPHVRRSKGLIEIQKNFMIAY